MLICHPLYSSFRNILKTIAEIDFYRSEVHPPVTCAPVFVLLVRVHTHAAAESMAAHGPQGLQGLKGLAEESSSQRGRNLRCALTVQDTLPQARVWCAGSRRDDGDPT